MSTPTFEDWKADQVPEVRLGSLESFLIVHHTAVWDAWRKRLQEDYRRTFGLSEPDLVGDLVDELAHDVLRALEYPAGSQNRTKLGIELFTKLKTLWQDYMKKDKNNPHYAELIRLAKTVCTECLGMQMDENGEILNG